MRNRSVLSGLFWRFAERCGAQGVSFVVSIVLARLLEPEVYGTIALITVFTAILNVFVDSGFGNALIQKKEADNVDFSTVFFFNIAACTLLYIAMFFAAPFIGQFYKNAALTPVIRVLSLTIIISGVKNVQQAYVSRSMQFKRFFFATLGGTLGAAIVGITMACYGFGVWALVAQQLFNATVDTLILWITVKWRPQFVFSFSRLKQLFSFGWKLLISSLLNTVYNDIYSLVIGKRFTATNLAYYNRGKQFPSLVISNVNASIDSVLFPTMSKAQSEREQIKAMTRRAIRISTYVMAPLMIGLIFIGQPLVRLFLTEKWLPCLPFMTVHCVTFVFYPIHSANLNAIKAMGKSGMLLKQEILKLIVGFAVLFSAMGYGLMAVAYSMIITSILSQIINSWPNKKMLNYGYLEQLKDIMPSILLSFVMGCCIYPVQLLKLHDAITLLIQVPLGIGIYICGSVLFKIDSLTYLWGVIKTIDLKKIKGSENS